MKTKWAAAVWWVCWSFLACAGPQSQIDRDELFREVISSMPAYQDFLTVDELHGALIGLKEAHPESVTLTVLGETEGGQPIYEFQVGQGANHALLFGFPHPNEPIGSMMLHHLTRELVENPELRDYFDFTWHIVVCADPDKAKLNEGWFKGPLSVTKYARNFYRPPYHQQVEWTFPVTYKDYTFDSPTPEARALMQVIEHNPIDFSFSLHNSGFGGAYFYWTDDVSELYPVLYDLIAAQNLPLHLGEPEEPFGEKLDDRAMFRMSNFSEWYDYLEENSPVPPGEVLNGGTSSDDFITRKYNALCVVCEVPYFYDPKIEDTSPSGMTRRQANLEGIAFQREVLHFMLRNYEEARTLLTVSSLFADAIEELARSGETEIETKERAVQADERYERQATVAEKWDALYVSKFYTLLNLGQFVRMLEHEKTEVGDAFPQPLQELLDESLALFEAKAAEVEADLDYTVVPIKKLASVQLFTALYAMDHVQHSPEFAARQVTHE
jgi:hypothetical protein